MNSKRNAMQYSDRARLAKNKAGKKLFELMEEKKTNICAAIDVTKKKEFLKMVKKVGEEVAVIKTHMEFLEDFDWGVIEELKEMAREKNFMVFEDRKFNDIGNTVRYQYTAGMHKIIEWAHLVNVNPAPGDSMVKALHEKARKKIRAREERGCLVLAQMTSHGNLFSEEFTKKAVAIGEKNSEFVCGFIGTSEPNELKQLVGLASSKMLLMTPGIMLSVQTDNFGQKYSKPEKAIAAGADALIIGRGIYQSNNPKKSAKRYRKVGWNAYKKRAKN